MKKRFLARFITVKPLQLLATAHNQAKIFVYIEAVSFVHIFIKSTKIVQSRGN